MLTLLPLLPLLLPAAGAAEPPAQERFTLDNGLTVVVEPRPSSGSVAVVASVKVGARNETPETSGCAHMLEHMLFTGTEKWSEAELKDAITRRGGEWNGYTNFERTLYFARLSADELPLAVEWVSQVVFHPRLDGDQLEKERKVVFQERGGDYGWLVNTADRLGFGYELSRAVRSTLFPATGLDGRIVGEDESLSTMDLATLTEFYDRHYVPSNTVLVVVGGVEVDEVRALVEQRFGDLPAVDAPPTPARPEERPGPHEVTIRGPTPTDQVSIQVGARTVGRDHPDYWPLQVLAELVRVELTDIIRYDRGWVYGLQTLNQTWRDAGYFVVKTRAESELVEPILTEIDAVLDRLVAGTIDPERVADAAAASAGRYVIEVENNQARAESLARWLITLPPGAAIPDYAAGVSAVTPEDLARVARTYLSQERRFTALHRPALTSRTALWFSPLIAFLVGAGTYRGILKRRALRRLLEQRAT